MNVFKEEKNFIFFEDEFLAEIDSWFTADIKCCTECYDDFISKWPIVIDREPETYSKDVHSFYSGSRMSQLYTKSEYLENLYRITCPRCGSSINDTFWAFEFQFDNYDDLEFDFDVLKQEIKETPYMVLKNKLALEVYQLLENISKKTSPISLNFTLYRGRILKSEEFIKSDFITPPPNSTNEGRYNHLGVPVLYCADKQITCYNELRKPKENLYIAEFKINKELKLLNLNQIDEFDDWDKYNLLQAIFLSSVVSSKTDDKSKYKPEYYFTRFICDCCKSLNFDGIIYPSVHIGEGNNYVIFDTKILKEEIITNVKKYN